MVELNGRAIAASRRIGEWFCRCGQAYRVLATGDEVRMWPRNSNRGYAIRPIDGLCVCGAPISRGTVLSSLFGAVGGSGVRVAPLDGAQLTPTSTDAGAA